MSGAAKIHYSMSSEQNYQNSNVLIKQVICRNMSDFEDIGTGNVTFVTLIRHVGAIEYVEGPLS